MTVHEKYMARCLQLAKHGEGQVAPNPMVGAVLVYENRIIGEGYHQKFGEAHAEVNCINSVTESDRRFITGATLYVSLEPCTHTGKTPPCTDLILAKGIGQVVIACLDPFEKVNGSGVELLRANGVNVETGILEKEARELNKAFFCFYEKQRPYIILKWAQTADGYIGSGNKERLMITGGVADILVHQWRSQCLAILVGTETALADDPQLTNRHFPGNSPVRMVADRHLKIPATHHLLSDGLPTIVITEERSGVEGGVQYYQVGKGEALLPVVINLLRQRNLSTLMVEGGAKTLQAFIDASLWDEARVITNEQLTIGAGLPAPVIRDAASTESKVLGEYNVKVYTKNPQS